ncbi:MAG: Mu transposase C-terminal domain-containing protein [Zoogloeaceae bacterium]|nr:Mu transposase C-terminal domain-containing protein [Zoogloeaceae bacterium]
MNDTGATQTAALHALIVGARAGNVDSATFAALREATDKRGRHAADGVPSIRTLKYWLAADDPTPRAARRRDMRLPPWAAAFLSFYQKPSRPPLSKAYADFLNAIGAGEIILSCATPSIHQARRLIASMNVIDKNRGRATGSAMRALLPYTKRDWAALKSNDVWIGDGHSFKAKVRHPVHGKPFQPEVTFVIDGASRRVIGWSAALSESTLAVSDALRHAQQVTRARPTIYYSDNGAGQTGKTLDAAVVGHLARQGIEHRTGIPGNPQGRGIIERLWQVTLIPLACRYDSCVWKGADKNYVTQMGKKIVRKDGGGVKLPTWAQFLDDVRATVDAYNSSHRNRNLEGMTPDEAYAAKLDPDSIVLEPGTPELESLWMPEAIRTPRRGSIELYGNQYFRRDLVERLTDGEEVIVRYDIHNKDKVWLFRMDGVYIGDADYEGNKRHPFGGEAVIEQLRAKRAAGKIRRAEAKIDEAIDEARPMIEMQPASANGLLGGRVIDMTAIRQMAEAETASAMQEKTPAAPARRHDYEAWLTLDARVKAGEAVSEDDAWWHQAFPASAKYRTEAKKWAEEHGTLDGPDVQLQKEN